MRGAGGTEGGLGRFFLGFVMLVAGGYLLLRSIGVSSSFHLGHGLYSVWGFQLTGGMVLVPFIFGIGIIFYNGKNLVGWALLLGSLIMLLFGVITSIRFSFRSMSAFDLLVILVLFFGGMGLFISSLKKSGT